MTLPEKVRDVTQSEWLEVRERLAAAEAACEGSDRYQDLLREHVRHIDDADKAAAMYAERSERFAAQADQLASRLARAEEVAEDARQVAEQVESRLALAMAWGAEVCATLDWLTRDSGVTHSMVGAWLDEGPVALARETQRAERAEAQRGHTSVAAINAALRDYPDADVSALWVPASEALEYQACWHRDVAKGRAAIEKREADLAAARAQLAQTEESLRLARNEILSGIDAEQLRVTREIQAARRDAERQRDVARSERDHAYDNADSIWAGVVGRLTKERDAARAQLAAVVAAAKAVIHVSVPPYTEEGTKLLRAWNAVLADPAQAAHEHDERVRAEERERCAKECDVQAMAERDDDGNGAAQSCAERIRALGSRS